MLSDSYSPDLDSDSEILALSPEDLGTISRKKFLGVAEKVLDLLGAGVSGSIAAATLGVSESYISQLLADEEFQGQVVELRYLSLKKHNARDDRYDSLEDKVIGLLEKALPLAAMDPMKLTKILGTVNAAKRRGEASPEAMSGQTTIVNLTMPDAIMRKFSVVKNADNMVIEAGEQKLITATSKNLLARLEVRKNLPGVTDVQSPIPTTPKSN